MKNMKNMKNMKKTDLNEKSVTVRFAGDSGDGIQLMGAQFAKSAAIEGNDFATFSDFPAEIRAPAGSEFGVSAYQINLGSEKIMTSGDNPSVLVAFNPAALRVNLPLADRGATLILNTGTFTDRNLKKAGYKQDPRDTSDLSSYQLVELDIDKLTSEAVSSFGLSRSKASRCKNFLALGIIQWIFNHKTDQLVSWIDNMFEEKEICEANKAALLAGYIFGEVNEVSHALPNYDFSPASFSSGEYRNIKGSDALVFGLAAAAELADLPMLFCSYPITPASSLLHQLSKMEELGVGVFQAEDEIASICAAIGASYGGAIGVTSSSGPGIALKTESIGLAINAELPLVIINSQRGGPSTGLPTKTEQSDLYQAVYGRNADSPIPVIATSSASDSFDTAIEAVKIAIQHMTPVILLTDGFINNSSQPWLLPDIKKYKKININRPKKGLKNIFHRKETTLARYWIAPGFKGGIHRTGGIEKDIKTGNISYDPENHQKMTNLRIEKIKNIVNFIPQQEVSFGAKKGSLAVVGWGSTFGAINQSVQSIDGHNVSHIHINYLNPFPDNLKNLLQNFDKILVPEMNMGQLSSLLRDKLNLSPIPFCKVSGQPFLVSELTEEINRQLNK